MLCPQLLHMMSCISLGSISKSCADQTVSRQVTNLGALRADHKFAGMQYLCLGTCLFGKIGAAAFRIRGVYLLKRSSCGASSTSSPCITLYRASQCYRSHDCLLEVLFERKASEQMPKKASAALGKIREVNTVVCKYRWVEHPGN